jgi:hypothetical protein
MPHESPPSYVLHAQSECHENADLVVEQRGDWIRVQIQHRTPYGACSLHMMLRWEEAGKLRDALTAMLATAEDATSP